MMKTPAYRLGVSKTGKINTATTWTLRISGSKHKVMLRKSWTRRVMITYDGHTVFEKRFILRSPSQFVAEWDRDGAVYEMRYYDRTANRYELQVDGVKFSDLPRVDALTRQESHQPREDRSTHQRQRATKAGIDNPKATSTRKAKATKARESSARQGRTSTNGSSVSTHTYFGGAADIHGSGGGGGGGGGCGGHHGGGGDHDGGGGGYDGGDGSCF